MVVILGLGGGFRVMVGFFGVMKVLYELGILDCVIYVVGFFGFTWLVYILSFSFINLNV